MAQSRLEKVGTIYTRITGLLKTGAMKEENKPIWFEIYKAFPPKYEPRFDRPGLETPVRPIFYAEDNIRARFYKDFKFVPMMDIYTKNARISMAQKFVETCKQLEKEGIPQDQIYDEAMNKEFARLKRKGEPQEDDSKSDDTKEIRLKAPKSKKKLNLQQIFEEKQEVVEELTEVFKPIRLSFDKLKEDLIKKDSDVKKEPNESDLNKSDKS